MATADKNQATKQTGNTSPLSVNKKIKQLAYSPQLYWFAGHVASTLCFLAWQILGFFSAKQARRFSKLTLLFQMLSYGIVIRQSVKISKASNKLQLMRNENVQYFVFAAILLSTSVKLTPWSKAATSFVIYSFFHSITYFQKNLLEHIPISIHNQAAIDDRITYIASNLNLQALYFASLSELMLTVDILLGIPGLLFSLFRDPLYVVFYVVRSLAVFVFLKLRHDESQYMKQAIGQFDAKIGGILNSPMAPPQLRALYYGPVKSTIARYASLVLVPRITSQRKAQ